MRQSFPRLETISVVPCCSNSQPAPPGLISPRFPTGFFVAITDKCNLGLCLPNSTFKGCGTFHWFWEVLKSEHMGEVTSSEDHAEPPPSPRPRRPGLCTGHRVCPPGMLVLYPLSLPRPADFLFLPQDLAGLPCARQPSLTPPKRSHRPLR